MTSLSATELALANGRISRSILLCFLLVIYRAFIKKLLTLINASSA